MLNDAVGRVDVITFDGHSYRVTRQCEMLLANDYISGNFELFASFKRDAKNAMQQKLRFEFRGKTLVVNHDGEVRKIRLNFVPFHFNVSS